MVNAWWELVKVMGRHVCDRDFPMAKRMLIRYGVALPSLFTPEQKELFSKAIVKNTTGEPVYYLDEWLEEVSKNHIALSATDEKSVRIPRGENGEQQKLLQLKAKNDGRIQTAEGFANAKESERQMMESELKNRVDALCEHERVLGLDGRLKAAYTDSQKALFAEIFERLRGLQKIDKDLASYLKDLEEAKEIGISLEQKLGDAVTSSTVDSSLIDDEFSTVRQMVKMTCGKRGNSFPMFTREFYHCPAHGTGFREEVINMLRWIEMNDRTAFIKKAKGVPVRIELGPRDIENGSCVLVTRHNREKTVVPLENLADAVKQKLVEVRDALYQSALENRERRTYACKTMDEITAVLEANGDGFIKAMWCGDEACEDKVKEVTGVGSRCIPFAQEHLSDVCVCCGKPAKHMVYWGKAY